MLNPFSAVDDVYDVVLPSARAVLRPVEVETARAGDVVGGSA